MSCTAPRTCGGGGTPGECGGCAGALPGPVMVDVGTFCIDSTEVTQAQYQEFLKAKGSDVSGQISMCAGNTSYAQLTAGCNGEWDPVKYANLPAACTSWCSANAYCKWAGKRLCGKIGGGPNKGGTVDRNDATKSQWYRACTNGGTTLWPYGNTFELSSCQLSKPLVGAYGNVGTAKCTGSAAPYNQIFDMSGNAWEWEDSCFTSGMTFCDLRGGDIYRAPNATDPGYAMYFQCSGGDAFSFDVAGAAIRCCAD
jgi:formylglycine-generating enzyme